MAETAPQNRPPTAIRVMSLAVKLTLEWCTNFTNLLTETVGTHLRIGLPGRLTTHRNVVNVSNMKAIELLRGRIVHSQVAFAEVVLWRLPSALPGSQHCFKYRLAYVVRGVCVLRYDNEAGKGDHRHYRGTETDYAFVGPDELIAAFQADIARWHRENRDS